MYFRDKIKCPACGKADCIDSILVGWIDRIHFDKKDLKVEVEVYPCIQYLNVQVGNPKRATLGLAIWTHHGFFSDRISDFVSKLKEAYETVQLENAL